MKNFIKLFCLLAIGLFSYQSVTAHDLSDFNDDYVSVSVDNSCNLVAYEFTGFEPVPV